MARKKNPTPAALLQVRLQNWASKHQKLDNAYVDGLITALAKNKNLPMWATLDPAEFLPYADVVAGKKRLNSARFISIVRNIMVFTPVAITWEAVSKATSAFAIFVQSNNAATINFLEFWQNGYDFLDHKWTISYIAQIDFYIVVLVIILSLIASALNESGRRLRMIDFNKVENERMSLVIALKLFLYTKREVTTLSMNQNLATAIDDLTNATASISHSSTRLDNSVRDFPKDTPLKKEFMEFFYRLNEVVLKKSK